MTGWIGLYVEEADVTLLHARLNEDPEIAFLVQDGPRHWQASWHVEELLGKMMLWHVPGGPLPLLARGGQKDSWIEDPFAGWQELRSGMDYSVPYFGTACPNTLLLELYVRGWRGREPDDIIPLSGISWYGASPLCSPHAETRQWWQRFRGWVRRQAVRCTRSGPLDGSHADVWAMPAALRSIQAGVGRSEFPMVSFPPPRSPPEERA